MIFTEAKGFMLQTHDAKKILWIVRRFSQNYWVLQLKIEGERKKVEGRERES